MDELAGRSGRADAAWFLPAAGAGPDLDLCGFGHGHHDRLFHHTAGAGGFRPPPQGSGFPADFLAVRWVHLPVRVHPPDGRRHAGVPAYDLQGIVKAATAVVSIASAIAVWRILPDALALPSPERHAQAVAALRESEARHRASFEHSPIPMHILSEDGLITAVSRSWLRLFGLPEAAAVGRHVTELHPSGADGWIESDLATLRANGEVHDLERRYLRHDGAVLNVLLSARLEARNGAAWIVCVLIDVTERRRTEAALRTSEERLHQAQKMEAIGQLTATSRTTSTTCRRASPAAWN
uniref:PAS domain-containing protein n=1 Tax=Rhodopila globiformis TaxID=1071 RepID=UPI00130480D8|nr:PAS domain S-box protein [Rhodopila globiformis]